MNAVQKAATAIAIVNTTITQSAHFDFSCGASQNWRSHLQEASNISDGVGGSSGEVLISHHLIPRGPLGVREAVTYSPIRVSSPKGNAASNDPAK